MADFEHNDNSGSMFVNERKNQPNHPDRTGSCKVGGVTYRVAGWIKPGKNGKKDWLSLAFTVQEEQAEPRAPSTRRDPPQGGFDSMDDDIPF